MHVIKLTFLSILFFMHLVTSFHILCCCIFVYFFFHLKMYNWLVNLNISIQNDGDNADDNILLCSTIYDFLFHFSGKYVRQRPFRPHQFISYALKKFPLFLIICFSVYRWYIFGLNQFKMHKKTQFIKWAVATKVHWKKTWHIAALSRVS